MKKTKVSDYEISIIKRLLFSKEDVESIPFKIGIYRYFKGNNNPLNQGRVSEIKTGKTTLGERSKSIPVADDITFFNFENIIKYGDFNTRLNPFLQEHILIIKARESMIGAISSFNNPMFTFRIESFIILSNIAWTNLLQSILKDKNISILDKKKAETTYLPLYKLILKAYDEKILDEPIRINLEILIKIRDEIVHSPEEKIPDDVISLLQANCFNFNKLITDNYGKNRSLDNTFSVALQMVNLNPTQLNNSTSYNKCVHVKSLFEKLEVGIDREILENHSYKYNILVTPTSVDKKNQADYVKFVNINSQDSKEISEILLKEKHIDIAEKFYHSFKDVILILQKERYKINQNHLINLNKKYDLQKNKKYAYSHKRGNKISHYNYSADYLLFVKEKIKETQTSN